jgi:hypothetical protein
MMMQGSLHAIEEYPRDTATQAGDQDENDVYQMLPFPELLLEMAYYQVEDRLLPSENPFRMYLKQGKEIADAGLEPVYLVSMDGKRVVVTSVERMDQDYC